MSIQVRLPSCGCKHLLWQFEYSDAELYSFPSLLGGDDWASGGPALCRRRAHPPGMPRPPLLFACVVRDGRSTSIEIWIQLQYIELPTNLDFVCKNKNYWVYMCTPMSYAGSAPTWGSQELRIYSIVFFLSVKNFFSEYAGELRIIVLRRRNSPNTKHHIPPWTRMGVMVRR